jgi:hypothetical protein
MAMKKCKDCGAGVSSKAESCPQCGARLKVKSLGCGGLLGIVILSVITLGAFGSLLDENDASDSSVENSTTKVNMIHESSARKKPESSSGSPQKTNHRQKWAYHVSKDSMSGKFKERAYVVSVNSLHLSFPYNGKNYGHLIVRQHPQYGLDVIVSVDQGQILCDVYTCKLKIRFDDGPVQNFTMAPAADQSTTVVFAKYTKWAIKKLRAAHKISVQVPMYQEGNQVLKFKVKKPLVWPPK